MGCVRIKKMHSEHSLNINVFIHIMPAAGTNKPENPRGSNKMRLFHTHVTGCVPGRVASTWSLRAQAASIFGSSSSISADAVPFKQRMRKGRTTRGHVMGQARKWITSPPPTFHWQELRCIPAKEYGGCRPGVCLKGRGRHFATCSDLY